MFKLASAPRILVGHAALRAAMLRSSTQRATAWRVACRQQSSAAGGFAPASSARTVPRSRTAFAGSVAVGVMVAALISTTFRPALLDEQALATKNDHLKGTKQPSGQKLIHYDEVQKHTTEDDCWVIIDGKVYDVTDFLPNHPGGPEIILANAGKDATKIWKPIHPPDALEILAPEAHLGPVDPTSVPAPEETGPTEEEKRIEEARAAMPDVGAMLLLEDFEKWGEKVLSGTAWNYYKSAADREITADENEKAFRRYFFRPRLLRDMTNGDTNTTFMGVDSSLPVFISPAAMAKLGHPLGEVNLTKGAGECGIVQGISINASCSLDEIMEARQDGQKVFFQIYLNKDRKASEALLQKVERLGAAAVIFTVDAVYRSKRTRDVRAKSAVQAPIKTTHAGSSAAPSKSPLGVSQAISGYQDTNLTWEDIGFIRASQSTSWRWKVYAAELRRRQKNTKLPLIVKGIQSVEDVALCAKAGVEGVIISNHGGRQCDFAPAPIDLLYEIRCTRPELFDKIEIMVDGGFRSGADVVKALALGAKAVGLGRPFLYANGTHGQEGVERVCQIMAEEITNTMRNVGANTIKDLKPEMVGPAGPWVGENRPPWAK